MSVFVPKTQGMRLRDRTGGPHVIVFANEKGGVGKSTLAFHTCVALANQIEAVCAIDLDLRQQSLGRALSNREATIRRLGLTLPEIKSSVLCHLTEAGLRQEINRIGSQCAFVIIDVAGHDSPVARFAMQMADTLVTPINESFVDLDSLGHLDPFTEKLKRLGHFSELISDLRKLGGNPGEWIVVPNRKRWPISANSARISNALELIAPQAHFTLLDGIGERVIYRDLYALGLTLFDLKHIPSIARIQPVAQCEMERMLAGLGLPTAISMMQISALSGGDDNMVFSPTVKSEFFGQIGQRTPRHSAVDCEN